MSAWGCFGAAFNNFLVETYDINGFDRGVLEFLRETPGVLLVAIFALLGRFSDWKVMRIGTACSLVAATLLLVPVRWAWAVAFIVIWALGEHLVMPVRQSLALSIAREGRSGESLGIVTGAINAGTVAGSVLVATLFYLGVHFWTDAPRRALYDATWLLVALLLAASLVVAGSVKELWRTVPSRLPCPSPNPCASLPRHEKGSEACHGLPRTETGHSGR